MITAFHHPGFQAEIGEHIMPIRKFALVADEVRKLPWVEMREPAALAEEDLLRVHAPRYVEAVRTGEPRALAESQKFPWSPGLFPSVLLTGGGVLAAARAARAQGVSAGLCSGFHHACRDHGEGFCTFNSLVVAAEVLRVAGEVRTVAVLDMDLHYGNGTAELAVDRPWLRVLSIYGNDYAGNTAYRDVTVKRHTDGPNHRSSALPAGCGGEGLLEIMEREIPWLAAEGNPDLLLYQAGADPYREDPYSPLDLGHEDLFVRDRWVFAWARQRGIPVAWVLAGGYTRDIEKVVRVHVNTFHACREAWS
jgi:acetoin utilization deacetylase AcuC-like enzyme